MYNSSSDSRSYALDEIKKRVPDIAVSNSTLSPNKDGINDIVTITINIAQSFSGEIIVENAAGVRIKTFMYSPSAGVFPVTWDGTDDNNKLVYNGTYYIGVILRQYEFSTHARFDEAQITVIDSAEIILPSPVQWIKPQQDRTDIKVGTTGYNDVYYYANANESFAILSFINEPDPKYEVKVMDGVIGRVGVYNVDITNLESIPKRWGRAAIAGVIVRGAPGEQFLTKDTLPKNAVVRILRQDGDWYRILQASGEQAYVKISGLDIISESAPLTYIVASGDTLWKISQKYNVSIDAILKANNINESTPLMIGQKLLIPTAASNTPSSNNIYLVQTNSPEIVYFKLSTRTVAFNGRIVPSYLTIDMETSVPSIGYIDVIGAAEATRINLSADTYKTEHVVYWVPWNDTQYQPLAAGAYKLQLNLFKADGSAIPAIDIGALSVVTESQPRPLIENALFPTQFTPKTNPRQSQTDLSYLLNRSAQVQILIRNDSQEYLITPWGTQKPGYYQIPWYGRDINGNMIPNGNYTMEIRAIDPFYNKPAARTYFSQSLKIIYSDYRIPTERVKQIVKGISLNSTTISPNGDGINDTITGTITFNEKVRADVDVVNAIHLNVKTLKSGDFAPGTYSFEWDGRMLAYNSIVLNGNYFIRFIIYENENIGEIVFTEQPIRVTDSNNVQIPNPTQRVRVIVDYTLITSVTNLGADYIGRKGEIYGLIDFTTEYTDSYRVLLAENIIGAVRVEDVEIIDLATIPLKWGITNKETVVARKSPGIYSSALVTLPQNTTLRILRTDNNWYRVVLNNNQQAYISVSDLTEIAAPPQPTGTVHTVASGDTLWKIAQKYGTTVDAIIKANNLNINSYLYIGQTLTIPTNPNPEVSNVYTVKAGDSLWKIAQSFGVTIGELAYANQLLPPYTLFINQKLFIPRIHVVVSGDTLWKIATKYNIPLQKIIQTNNLDISKPLYIGQRILIY